MRRRDWLAGGGALVGAAVLAGCATQPPLRGTADLGIVIERESGSVLIIDTTARRVLTRVEGFGDLSHASAVFSRDARHAYVFGRDGALTKLDLLTARIVGRVQQAGNSIGGAISADGRLVAAQNYAPGGVKVFDAQTLAQVADIPAEMGGGVAGGKASRVVGLVDLPGSRFAYSLFDADAIWIADLSETVANGAAPRITKLEGIGKQPYDALVTPDGRHYIAGLFGEDGLAMVDLWAEPLKVRRILGGYGRGQEPLPVYKMPHLRGWAVAGRRAWLPAIGRREVLVVDTQSWQETARVAVAGQPVFVMARPDGRQVWVNFAVPDYDTLQVIDTERAAVVQTLKPGKAIMHMEFTPRGEAVWVSARDSNTVTVLDTRSFATLAQFEARAPSGIFFAARAVKVGL